MRIFSFRPETPFLSKFQPKIQNCQSMLKFGSQANCQLEYAEFKRDVHFSCFRPEIPFLGKFGPKSQNCQFEWKFDTYANVNMQDSMMVFIFSIFDQKFLFWGKFAPKNQYCLL